jgi:glycine cleavage system aminomethyltransferase T
MSADYTLCRDAVALIDLADEARFVISGPGAEAALNALVSVDVSALRPWRGTMGLFLRPNASILAIATIFKADGRFYVFAEADAAEPLRAYLAEGIAAKGATFTDLAPTHAWLAVTGPSAQETMINAAGDDIVGLPFLSCERNARLDANVFRMGNTGEFEYRVLVDTARAGEAASKLEAAGAGFGIQRAASDVMRTLLLEMRSLSRRDLPEDASPLEAGLQWMVDFRKVQPVAGDALQALKDAPRRRCVAVAIDGPAGRVKPQDRLFIEGQDVGFLASVEFSVTLGRPVGVAFVSPEFGWVGVSFVAGDPATGAVVRAVSAPLLVTKTAKGASA